MKAISDVIKNKPNLYYGKGVTEEEIDSAEKDLNLFFNKEYKDYLLQYGLISYDNHELTGLCNSQRLNVVYVTKEEGKNNPQIPTDYYVIEQANIDGIVIWQNFNGEVFRTFPDTPPVRIADSLSEYIESI
nr:SMI1/KNR4 family protein [uncultured Ruminococcus sp.]